MAVVQSGHFGGNIILTNDGPLGGSAFSQMLQEVGFSSLRYPGGGITEAQTWGNGGLAQIFSPSPAGSGDGAVVSLYDVLALSAETGTGLTIVVPTFQFAAPRPHDFDSTGFERYVSELEAALRAFPDAKINDLELGNEYWGSIHFEAMTAGEYGDVANAQIPYLHDMIARISATTPDWQVPGIGIQAGAAWRASGGEETREIAAAIDPENREHVTTILQHSYPDMSKSSTEWQRDWAIDPMKIFIDINGFADDLKLTVSEFNIAANSATGIAQGAAWIEEFAAYIDAGVAEFHHWGLAYKWLSNKFYDTRFPLHEANGGEILAKATPMGQIYDLAQSNLVGKATLSDTEALADLSPPDGLTVTGFADAGQRVLFLYNGSDSRGALDLTKLPGDSHIAIHHLIAADSPLTDYDESAISAPKTGEIVDSRADMKVESGIGLPGGSHWKAAKWPLSSSRTPVGIW